MLHVWFIWLQPGKGMGNKKDQVQISLPWHDKLTK